MTNRCFWPGLVLVILGVLFLLDQFEVASFGDLISTYWPVILILVGFGMILRRGTSRDWRFSSKEANTIRSKTSSDISADRVEENSVFGNISLKPTSKDFKGGNLSVVFGDIDLNLTSTELAEGVQYLRSNGVFGGISITLPKDVPVQVRSHCLFGDIKLFDQKKEGISSDLFYKSETYDRALKKLSIDVSQVFGDIKIW